MLLRSLLHGAIAVVCTLPVGGTQAQIRLSNRDKVAHDITYRCAVTTHARLGPQVSRALPKGPCSVTIKQSGSKVEIPKNARAEIVGGMVRIK